MLFQRCVQCRWNCSLQIRTHDTILQRKINTKHDCVTHTATSTGKQSRRPSLRILLTYTCETGWQSNECLPIYGRRMTTDSAFQLNKRQWITESRSWKNVRLFDAVFQHSNSLTRFVQICLNPVCGMDTLLLPQLIHFIFEHRSPWPQVGGQLSVGCNDLEELTGAQWFITSLLKLY